MGNESSLDPQGQKTMRPLCVDLDGTLVRSDTFHEAFVALLFSNPLNIFRMFQWALRGKAYLKSQICARVACAPELFPYSAAVLDYVRQQKQAGRRVILVTGAFETLAHSVAAHTTLFDDVVATNEATNLTGRKKRDELVRRYGQRGFDYIGNSRVDIPVWECAHDVIVASATHSLLRSVSRRRLRHLVLDNRVHQIKAMLSSLRIHQWSKNALILLPLLVSHKFIEASAVLSSLVAFGAFCCAASAIYLLNDLADIQSDRSHSTKRSRALAAGLLSVPLAGAGVIVLLTISFVLAGHLSAWFAASLGVYAATSVSYSFFLKRVVLLDIVTLGLLYTCRVVAGAFAIGVRPSFWLLAFSLFLFFSLATLKRYSELRKQDPNSGAFVPGRGYRVSDIQPILQIGVSSGNVAALVLALYINSAEVRSAYSAPSVLWMLVPLAYFTINRMWLEASRGKIDEDPVLFALKDKQTLGVVAFAIMLVVIAWLGVQI